MSDSATPPPLSIRGLSVAYDGDPVLEGVDLDLRAGSLVAIVGPNGAGKSTLLRAALGLVPTLPGARVEFFGRPFAEVRRSVSFLPQRESVDWDFPARVVDVVAMGLYGELGLWKRLRRRHVEAAHAALARVGMEEFVDRQIGQLSGGQQKRVFLARSLVQGASLFLLDEPFAGVDATSEAIIGRELEALRDAGATVVVVHHDLAVVRRTFDRCVLLCGGVEAEGPVEEVLTAERVARAYGGIVPLALMDADRPSGERRSEARP